MIAAIKPTTEYRTVEDLMSLRDIHPAELVQITGIERRVVDAIVHQRYTPSPQQRKLVSNALDFPRGRIVWGHRAAVEHLRTRP